jgi:hypothetical protein
MPSSKKRKINKKSLILVISIVLILCVSVGSTLAFLVTKTDVLQNVFSPSYVSVLVSGTKATNAGETKAFLRMTAAITLQSTSDQNVYLGSQPLVENTNYTLQYTDNGWTRGADGYYYYPAAVDVNESVSLPTVAVTLTEGYTVPSGYQISVQYLVTAIQASPSWAVQNAWGGDASGDSYTPAQ